MRARRPLFAVAATALAAALYPAAADAHAILERSEPADASSLSGAPKEVRLWFSERLRPEFTRVELRDLQGKRVAVRSVHVKGREVTMALPALPRGTYSVGFTPLSIDDGHLSKGEVVFGAGTRVAVPPSPGEARPPLLEVVLRWLNLVLLTVLVGAVAVARFVVGPAGADRAHRRVLVTATAATVVALPAGVVLYGWQVSQLGKAVSGTVPELAWRLLDSRWGTVWVARELLLVALVVLLVRALRSGREPRWIAALLALGLVAAQAMSGHANGLPSGRGLALVADATHLLGASIWIGGLVCLVVSLYGQPHALVYGCWRRFGALAAVGVGALAVSGLYLLGRQVASLDALVTTVYGQALLVKTALLGLAGLLGLCTFLALRRSAAGTLRQVPRLTAVEASVGLVILLAAGVLTAAVPARGPQFAAAPKAPRDQLATSVADLVVVAAIRPNRPGQNVYDVRAVSTRRPAPAPIRRVRLLFAAVDGRQVVTPPLRSLGDGRYRLGGDELARSGRWTVVALVERTGLPTARASFRWSVGAAAPPSDVVLSDRPLGPIMTRVAAGAALLLLLAVALVLTKSTRLRPIRPSATHRAREQAL